MFTDFTEERAAFARVRDSLLPAHEGEFVVIRGDRVLGTRGRLEDALDLGFTQVGGPQFFTAVLTAAPQVAFLPAVVWAH